MTPDQELAALSAAAYTQPPTVSTDDAHALIKERDDVVMIACRGTNPRDWIDLWRDVSAIDFRNDPIFGHVPDSIISDAEQLAWRVWPMIKGRKVWVTGHSKGGGEAQGLAGMLLYMGASVEMLTTFAALRMGQMGGLIAGLPGRDYCFEADEVPKLPPHALIPRVQSYLPWGKPPTLDLLAYHSMTTIAASLPAG